MPPFHPPGAIDLQARFLGLPVWLWCTILAAVLLFAGLWLGLRVTRALRARCVRRQHRRGEAGERVAVRLLTAAGYEILDRQVGRDLLIEVDGRLLRGRVQADLLVARDGRRFVAEVKNGTEAANPARRETRRQLLEYAHAFGGHDLLLVDIPQRRIRSIRFPGMA